MTRQAENQTLHPYGEDCSRLLWMPSAAIVLAVNALPISSRLTGVKRTGGWPWGGKLALLSPVGATYSGKGSHGTARSH